VAETGSTNADLIAAVECGEATDRTVLRTDHQTAGRGRLDRTWDAPPGANLLASLLFVAPTVPLTVLPQAVGLAALEAVESLVVAAGGDPPGPRRLGMKWPNDLLLDGKKLSGVLAQRSSATDAVVVGIGLNVAWAPDSAASLSGDLGLDVAPADLLDELLVFLHRLLTAADVMERYRTRLLTVGMSVRAELPGGRSITGVATGVDDHGRLQLVSAADNSAGNNAGSKVITLDVGDIVHLRPTSTTGD
jgi:BirA family biotin operon repressor/biotin-[acetyl-CoA-carboxylase] ligase